MDPLFYSSGPFQYSTQTHPLVNTMATEGNIMGLRTQILDNLRYVNPFSTEPLIITSYHNGTWMAISRYRHCYHHMSIPCDLFSGHHATVGAALSQLLEITSKAVFRKLYADAFFYASDVDSDYEENYTYDEGEDSQSVESDYMEWLPEKEREKFFYAMNAGGSESEEYDSEEEEEYHTMLHMMQPVGQVDLLGEGEVDVDGYLEEWIPEQHSLTNSVDDGSLSNHVSEGPSEEWVNISY